MIGVFFRGAVVGGLVTIFWGVISFILFGARESMFTKALSMMICATCPPWCFPVAIGIAGSFLTLVLNATLYGAAACLIHAIRYARRAAH